MSVGNSGYYVAKGEESLGPWTIEEVARRIAMSEISITDFVYDDGRQDWVPLMEFEPLRQHLNKAKPKAPPPTKQASQPMTVQEKVAVVKSAVAKAVSNTVAKAAAEPQPQARPQPSTIPTAKEDQWFVQKGAERYGPMTYLDVVHALQEKSVYDFDFVWKEGMETWVRVAEHREFQPERIRDLATKLAGKKDSDEVFFKRKFPRLKFESEVIVHDDRSVWMGQAFEASVGGSGVVIENSTLTPGQVVRLHFAPCDGLPAFNALGEIVGKRYSREIRGTKSPVRYAVRFLKLDGSAEPAVREYFESKSAS